MRNNKNVILKIGDKVKNESGIRGKLENIKGKTHLKHSDGIIPLDETDIKALEKI